MPVHVPAPPRNPGLPSSIVNLAEYCTFPPPPPSLFPLPHPSHPPNPWPLKDEQLVHHLLFRVRRRRHSPRSTAAAAGASQPPNPAHSLIPTSPSLLICCPQLPPERSWEQVHACSARSARRRVVIADLCRRTPPPHLLLHEHATSLLQFFPANPHAHAAGARRQLRCEERGQCQRRCRCAAASSSAKL